MSEIKSEIVATIADVLQKTHGFATVSQLDCAIANILRRTSKRTSRGPQFSLSKMIRGMVARSGEAICEATREDDVAFSKALVTTGTPGSYLVPTQQADEIIQALLLGGIARQMGVRI